MRLRYWGTALRLDWIDLHMGFWYATLVVFEGIQRFRAEWRRQREMSKDILEGYERLAPFEKMMRELNEEDLSESELAPSQE